MARKSKKMKKFRSEFTVLLSGSIILIGFYLYGKVQIDFIIRQNEQLARERDLLKREVTHLRIQIGEKKQYQRIVRLAKTYGLAFVPAIRSRELVVDVSDLSPRENYAQSFACADINPLSLSSWVKKKSEESAP